MTIALLFLFLHIVAGFLFSHLIWGDRDGKSLFVKTFLGAGIGFGINSLLFFLYLMIFNHLVGYLFVQSLFLIVLIALVFLRDRDLIFQIRWLKKISYSQALILLFIGGLTVFALLVFLTISRHKIFGTWDAIAMYNRTARFIFRGGEFWKSAFSEELPWYFHADYPPLLALNIASGWHMVGKENISIPIGIGGTFLFGSMGLLFAGINTYKTLGQAALATSALLGVGGYIAIGSWQIADIPLAFFILATNVSLYLHAVKKQKGLFVLGGLSAGLAAWTKNEGIVFALISSVTIFFVYRNNLKCTFKWFMTGIILPIAIVIFFKMTIAPPGDLFITSPIQIYQIIDISSHEAILKQLLAGIKSWTHWTLLIIYALVLGVRKAKKTQPAILAGVVIFILQLLSYYGIFLLTPHDLDWHLFSFPRILLQIAPLFFFLYFSFVQEPESILHSIETPNS